jgi:hypothetical protein
MSMERLYPESLIRMYFNYIQSNDIRPTYEDFSDFINEMQGYYESNGRDAAEIKAHITKTRGNEQ